MGFDLRLWLILGFRVDILHGLRVHGNDLFGLPAIS